MNKNKKVRKEYNEGYFIPDQADMPKESKEEWEGYRDFIIKFLHVEQILKNVRNKKNYGPFAVSGHHCVFKSCNTVPLPSREFKVMFKGTVYKWPEGYRDHYI